MSFTSRVKKEILNIETLSNEEKLTELIGIFQCKDALLSDKILLKLENIDIARRVYNFLKELTTLKIGIKYVTSKKLGTHKIFSILIEPQNNYMIFRKKININTDDLLKNEKLLNSYIRGVFLVCGYVKDPKNEYALDFFVDSESTANELLTILKKLKKKVFKTKKRNKNLVYLRNSEDIMDILVLAGSMQEFFNYEEVTIMKDLKNKTIREMNWEVANETKTLNTAMNQVSMINYIDDDMGLVNLTSVLEEVAKVRLENPESSLQEIADIIGISKSGVRNRFKRLEEIYQSLLIKNEKSGDNPNGNHL